MMSQVIHRETIVFLMAAGHGAMLALFYDILRALRRVIPHSMGAVSAEDFLFWIAAGFLTFCLLFMETDGEIRGYVAVGIGLGTVLYLQIFSSLVRTALAAMFGFVKKLLRLLYRMLLFPFRKLYGGIVGFWCKIVRGIVGFWRKNEKKTVEIVREIKKRIEFSAKRVYNKKKRAEKRRKKTGVHMHRQYERGSLDDSGRKKKARKQKQPQRDAGHCGRGSLFTGCGTGSEPEADSKK